MDDILAKKNRHLFLEEKDNTHNSFISNINYAVENIDTIKTFNDNVNSGTMQHLLETYIEQVGTEGNAWVIKLTELGENILATTSGFNYAAVLTVNQDIAVGATITLPEAMKYRVGTHMLLVSWNGTVCYNGEQYEEVGAFNEKSTVIKIKQDIKIGDKIEFRTVALADTASVNLSLEDVITSYTFLENLNIGGYAKSLKNRLVPVHFLHDRPSFACSGGLNGAACDGTYLYYVINSDVNDTYQTIQKVNLSTGETSFSVQHSDLGHANSMTCDDDYLYVAPGDIDNPYIYKLDKTTLTTVASIDISETCTGEHCGCMGYNPDDGKFYLRGGKYVHVYSSNFEFITKFEIQIEGLNNHNYSTHALCFYEGYMYGLVCGGVPSADYGGNVRESINYIVKFNSSGKYEKAWMLDVYEEGESLAIYKDRFIFGVNTSVGKQYDFYTIDFLQDRTVVNSDLNWIGKKALDYDAGNRSGRVFYVVKNADSKLVGSGKQSDPFNSLNEALYEARKLAARHEWGYIRLYVSGNFTDETAIFRDIPTNIKISVLDGDSATLGSVIVDNCKKIEIENPVNLSVALTNSAVTAVSVRDSVLLFGCNITSSGSSSNTTTGIDVARGTLIASSSFTITGFTQGIYCSQDSRLYSFHNRKILFSNCSKKIVGRQCLVFTDTEEKDDAVPFSDSASLVNIGAVDTAMLTVTARGQNANNSYSYLKVNFNNSQSSGAQHAAYIESYYGSSRGARLLLTNPQTGFTDPGSFLLQTSDGTNSPALKGKPDGTLTWNGQSVSTSSDERLKTPISNVPEDVIRAWGDVQWGQFKFLDAVKVKGDAARFHTGLIAQKVKAVFEEKGLDACTYGILCHEVWEDEYEEIVVVDSPEEYDEDGNVVVEAKTHVERKLVKPAGDEWQIRYEEALALECAYQRWLGEQRDAKIEALMQRISALENNH